MCPCKARKMKMKFTIKGALINDITQRGFFVIQRNKVNILSVHWRGRGEFRLQFTPVIDIGTLHREPILPLYEQTFM